MVVSCIEVRQGGGGESISILWVMCQVQKMGLGVCVCPVAAPGRGGASRSS